MQHISRRTQNHSKSYVLGYSQPLLGQPFLLRAAKSLTDHKTFTLTTSVFESWRQFLSMRNSLLTSWVLIPLFLIVNNAAAAENAAPMNSSAPDTIVGWYTGSSERSTLSLVYSCLITTFACTWTVLHLNVPGLGESSWTRLIRKAKWMAITILLPEFIFSKAVCELRLALKDLHAFDKRLQEEYTSGLGCRSLVSNPYGEQFELFRQWRVQYSASALLLFPFLGLPRPDTQCCIRGDADGMERLGRVRVDGEAVVEDSSNESMDHNSRPHSQQSPDRGEPSTGREQEAEQRACSLDLVVGTTPTSRHEAHGPTIPILNPKRPLSVPSKGDGNLETYEQGRRCQSLPNVHREYTHKSQSRTVIETGGDTRIESSSLRRSVGSGEVRPSSTIHEWQDWTLAHSYLANMGGIIHGYKDFRDKMNYKVLTGNKLCHLSWENEKHPLKQLVLSQEDIADRSKADWFLRALAVLQISWLVLTVIARHVSSLPLTQLELATSAFSVFAVATYAVNWWKPKDISQPIRLLGYGEGKYDHSEPTQPIVSHLRSPAAARNRAKSVMDAYRIGNDVVELQGRLPLIFQLMAFAAFMFGGIHCLAWNFAFPSRAEAILWRTASVASAVVPILPLAASIGSNHVITVAEDDTLSLLKSELSWLGHFSSSYMDLLTNPGFLRWNGGFKALFCKPAGTREFSHEPSVEEIHELGKIPQKISDKYYIARRGIGGVLHSIHFLSSWQKGEIGDLRFDDLDDLSYDLSKIERMKGFLIDYEISFVNPTAIPNGGISSERTVIQYMDDIYATLEKNLSKVEHTKNICERVSYFSMLVCGTFYIVARVIIIVLLFTSLREVPLGVYQETPWTRFLPSFS